MSFKKDDKVTFVIEDIGTGGEGIGKVDGYTLFVKDAIIGDKIEAKIIKAKKNYGYARLEKIIEASSDRVTPACPVARQCGGCQIQQMSYQAQLRFKEKLVDDNLKRIGKIEGYEFFPAIGMEEPFRYRNKAQYPVGTAKDGSIVMGFYAGRTHSIISCTDCKIGAVENQYILAVIKSWMELNGVAPYDEQTGRGLVRHVLIRTGFHTDEIMVCLVINGTKMSDKLKESLVGRLTEVSLDSDISSNQLCLITTWRTLMSFLADSARLCGEKAILKIISVTLSIRYHRFRSFRLIQDRLRSCMEKPLNTQVLQAMRLYGTYIAE